MNLVLREWLFVVLVMFLSHGCGRESEDVEVVVQCTDSSDGARPCQLIGDWYPSNADDLTVALNQLLLDTGVSDSARYAKAILIPHANLTYSGFIQAAVFARVKIPDLVILLAPNHSGEGLYPAIWDAGLWLIPTTTFSIRHDVVTRLQEKLPDLVVDQTAFMDHPHEMTLPFIGHANSQVSLVPLSFDDNSRLHFQDFSKERIAMFGNALAELVLELEQEGETVLIVSTTDLVHRLPVDTVNEQDTQLLEHIVALDVDGLYAMVTENQTSICGEIPTAITMFAVQKLGAERAELIAHGTSADMGGSAESAVGYPGVIVW